MNKSSKCAQGIQCSQRTHQQRFSWFVCKPGNERCSPFTPLHNSVTAIPDIILGNRFVLIIQKMPVLRKPQSNARFNEVMYYITCIFGVRLHCCITCYLQITIVVQVCNELHKSHFRSALPLSYDIPCIQSVFR